ncbi:MAG: hypothetical protein ACRD0B_00430 [Acidimicrobiales bacterium]
MTDHLLLLLPERLIAALMDQAASEGVEAAELLVQLLVDEAPEALAAAAAAALRMNGSPGDVSEAASDCPPRHAPSGMLPRSAVAEVEPGAGAA